MTTRRGLLTGLGTLLVCAPAIVRASSLMPVRAWQTEPRLGDLAFLNGFPIGVFMGAVRIGDKRAVQVRANPSGGEFVFDNGVLTFSPADAKRFITVEFPYGHH